MRYLVGVTWALAMSLGFVSCGKDNSDPKSKLTVISSPDSANSFTGTIQVYLAAMLAPGKSGASVDQFKSGKIYYTTDGSTPTTDSSSFELKSSSATSTSDATVIPSSDAISLSSNTTIKAIAVVSTQHKTKKTTTIGQKKEDKETNTMTSAVTELAYTVAEGDSTASTSTGSSTTDVEETVLCTSTSTAASDTNETAGQPYDSSTNYGLAQSFTLSSKAHIKSFAMGFYKTNGWQIPASVTMGIQADSSNSPSGTFLASKTVDVSTINSIGVQYYTATLDSYVTTSASTKYWMVVHCPNCSSSVKFQASVDGSNSYSSGTFARKNSSGVWVGQSDGYDAYFVLNKCAN